jgi:hypothetical protein
VSRDLSDVSAQVPAAGLDEDERMAEARARLKDEVSEFVPTELSPKEASE